MKTTLKGVMVAMSKIETIEKKDKSGSFRTANIYVHERGITNEYGEQLREGQTHEIKCFNKALDMLPPEVIDGAINGHTEINPPEPVELEIYVNTKRIEKVVTEGKKSYNKVMYITELTPRSIKFPLAQTTQEDGKAN